MTEFYTGKAARGVLWSAFERFSVQGVQFLLSIWITRLVAPSAFGLIAMLGIFLAVAQTFVDSGFSNALIQKKNRTQTDFSTVFYFNIVIALLFYGLIYAGAPFISRFYEEPQLSVVARWVGLNIVIAAFSMVQRARLTIELDFKTQAKASLVSVVIGGALGIYYAYRGYGVWALVIQSLVTNVLNTILLWIVARWSPSPTYSWDSFRTLFRFGSKLLASGLINTIYLNLYSLVIGKRYSATDVGYYNRAFTMASFPSVNLTGVISRAIYPIQCEMQDDLERQKKTFLQYLRMSAYIIFPLMVGLAVLSKELIVTLFTEQWLDAAPLLSIISVALLFYPLYIINGSVLNANGRSDYVLKGEIIKKSLAIAILFGTLPFGLRVICYGLVFYGVLDWFVTSRFSKKILRIGLLTQLRSLLPVILLSGTMGIFVFGLT